MSELAATSVLFSAATALALSSPVRANHTPPGIDAAEWQAVQKRIVDQVDAEFVAGDTTSAVVRGGTTGPDLVRIAVVSGDYGDLPDQTEANGPEFGYSIAMDGGWLAVGAPGTLVDGGPNLGGVKPNGAVFVFQREQGSWQLRQRIVGAYHGAAPRCGHSVALKLPHLVLGCPGAHASPSFSNQEGRTRYFRLNEHGAWVSSTHGSTHADTFGDSRCGTSVAVSASGASNGDAVTATGCPGWDSARGRVLTRTLSTVSGSWSSTTQLMASNAAAADRFGQTVAIVRDEVFGISARRLAVGAPSKQHGGAGFAGSVYVFEDSPWTQTAHITGPSPSSFSSTFFGSALAITNNQLIIGARGGVTASCPNAPRCGTVTRYQRISNAWQFQEGGGAINAGGNPAGEQPSMWFGNAVAIGFDNWVAVAAPRADRSTATLPPGIAANVGMVELRRNDVGGFGVGSPQSQGELRPGAIIPGVAASGQFGTAIAFGDRRLAIGYPFAGTLSISGTVRRGQVWIYEEDRIFANDFEL